jgi:hypothetical protein
MNELNHEHPFKYPKRWFAYFDLLGFTKLVESQTVQSVVPVYKNALEKMNRACKVGKSEAGLVNSWFSDTFIIYTRSDSLQNFVFLEQAARVFFELLLINHIPVRGCISYGDFYSQTRQRIFLGPALIEAHFYGEALNWVGLCIAPSVEKRLENELPMHKRLLYRKVCDKNILRSVPTDHVYAFAFRGLGNKRENPYRKALTKMRSVAPPEAVEKYDHSLAFLDRHN